MVSWHSRRRSKLQISVNGLMITAAISNVKFARLPVVS